jgi:hypothetical protein
MTLKIQHKRSAVKAKAPQPTDLEYGEIAVNYEASDPCIYIKDSANTIRRIGSQPGVLVFKGAVAPTSTAPTAPSTGHVYIMNAAGTMAASWTGMAGKNVVQNENIVWDGTEWETLGATYTSATVTTADTAPTNPKDGDLWYDSVGGELYVWYDSDDAGAAAGTWVQANPQPTPKQATAAAAGVDVKLWKKTGTTLEPETANDGLKVNGNVFATAAMAIGSTAAPGQKLEITSDTFSAIRLNATDKFFDVGVANNSQAYRTFYVYNHSTTNRPLQIATGDQVLVSLSSGPINGTEAASLQVDGLGATGIAIRGGTNNFLQAFYSTGGTLIGSITGSTGAATSFNTASDYRLKENIVSVTDGIARLKALKPCRFNFKTEPGRTVDGFIAHEAQAVIPEAVTGAKDEADANGNPIHQGIDQSKLVPLLTAALQEAIAKIESLETRITTLEARP